MILVTTQKTPGRASPPTRRWKIPPDLKIRVGDWDGRLRVGGRVARRVGGSLDHPPEITRLTLAEDWPGFSRVDSVVEAGWDWDGMIEIDAQFSVRAFPVFGGGAVGTVRRLVCTTVPLEADCTRIPSIALYESLTQFV